MTSTLWFWIMCLIVLLFVIWFIRKLIGRVIIICVVLFILFLIWRWISPSTADGLLNWFQDLPVKATNFVNTELLNKDIVLPLHNPVKDVVEDVKDSVEGVVDEVDSTIDELTDVPEITVKDEEGPRYSWLSKLFSSDETDNNEEVTVEEKNYENTEIEDGTTGAKQFVEKRHEGVDLKLSENGEIVIETITSSGEKIVDKVAKVGNGSGDQSQKEEVKAVEKKEIKKEIKKEEPAKKAETTKKEEKTTTKETKKVDTTKKEENEVVYLKSNPKKEETKTTTTKTTSTSASNEAPVKAVRGLTADEVREANAIFN